MKTKGLDFEYTYAYIHIRPDLYKKYEPWKKIRKAFRCCVWSVILPWKQPQTNIVAIISLLTRVLFIQLEKGIWTRSITLSLDLRDSGFGAVALVANDHVRFSDGKGKCMERWVTCETEIFHAPLEQTIMQNKNKEMLGVGEKGFK